jgi:hypothetical protein
MMKRKLTSSLVLMDGRKLGESIQVQMLSPDSTNKNIIRLKLGGGKAYGQSGDQVAIVA